MREAIERVAYILDQMAAGCHSAKELGDERGEYLLGLSAGYTEAASMLQEVLAYEVGDPRNGTKR